MASFPALALRDRAHAFLLEHGSVSEAVLLSHVYGGQPPRAVCAQLSEPLLGDARFERHSDGTWAIVEHARPAHELTALALVATGPSPARGRLVQLCALHVRDLRVVGRFSATINPGKRVPRYVAERLGLEPEHLDELLPFESIVDDLAEFLDRRPIAAQDAALTWSFVEAEARRYDRALAEYDLIDVNQLADRVLDLHSKPTLARVAAHLGIGALQIGRPEEEARLLAEVMARLADLSNETGQPTGTRVPANRAVLRRGESARALPDQPGVYVLRDTDQAALYVGKARRLRSRLEAYVHRPLGATRRLEGLVGAVEGIDPTLCATDLEALLVENREIRRLQPRFNTARQLRTPRFWIRLPPAAARQRGRRPPAPRRLELSLGPRLDDGEFAGPFRNENAAEQARLLARTVFDLDALRREDPDTYEERLRQAWEFLTIADNTATAEVLARQRSRDVLRAVLAFDLLNLLLPADPREARYAVIRPGSRVEGFLIDRGIFRSHVLQAEDDVHQFSVALLADVAPRTGPEEMDVVLRWFGAQRPPARLVLIPDDAHAAADAIEDAALAAASWPREA